MPKLYHEGGFWLVPGHQSRKALRVDVPGSPFDLAGWLNDRRVSPTIVETDRLSEEEFAEVAEAAKTDDEKAAEVVEAFKPLAAAKRHQTQWTADEIVEFILDHATVNQCASILSCLGTRFGELAKEVRK